MSLIIGGTLAWFFLPLPWSVIVILGLAAFEVFEIMIWVRWRQRRSIAGAEGLVGARGVLAPGSRVRIRGTTYPARVLNGADGDAVVVEEVEGITLVVRRA
ncbi:MAG TPA: hypothetical protein VE754_00045 [Actinomycetota bacterium]|nr:hypothetical protein [Actinomycetota bacterium]